MELALHNLLNPRLDAELAASARELVAVLSKYFLNTSGEWNQAQGLSWNGLSILDVGLSPRF